MEHYKVIDGKRVWYGNHTHYNQNNQSHKGHTHTDEYKQFMSEQSTKLQKMRKGYTDIYGNRRWLIIGQEVPEGWTEGWPPRSQEFKDFIRQSAIEQWQNPEIREKMIRGLRYGNSRTNYSK